MKIKLLALSLPFLFLSVPVHAQSLEQLRQDVSWLKTSVQNSNQKVAEAMNLLTTMQQEFASMKGISESGGHFYEEQNRSLKEYDQRLAAMEDKLNILTNLLKDIKDKNANVGLTTSPEKIGSADMGQTQEFQKLLDYVNSEDWNKSLSGFQAFLQRYPKSPLADNAQYWVAESYYGLGDYKKSIAEHQVLIQKYPRSPKAKNSLLKQGYAFYNLKMYAEAKPFLEKVVTDYPNTSEAAKASAKIKDINRALTNPAPAMAASTPAINEAAAVPTPAPTLAPAAPADPRFPNSPSPSPAPPSSGVAPQNPNVNTSPPTPARPPISGTL